MSLIKKIHSPNPDPAASSRGKTSHRKRSHLRAKTSELGSANSSKTPMGGHEKENEDIRKRSFH